MAGTTRAQRRAHKGDIDVFPAETSLGWRVIRQASQDEAQKKLATGEWREVQDEAGNFIGCQVLANFKKDEDLPSGASSTSISPRECLLNAAGLRESRTANLPEERKISRKSRFGKALPPEDAIERAVAKVREFGAHRLVAAPLVAEIPIQGSWDAFVEFARVED
jgi:hypothetical protein